ncbi:hypothetical protein V6N12_065776 [Hibiscus sabdariffa]|uniref:Uncharacterized protein n=1 Tax=Hibiscus sabdariffa TaxID=183260 RepID=A0ABR2GAQ0_9ROSI
MARNGTVKRQNNRLRRPRQGEVQEARASGFFIRGVRRALLCLSLLEDEDDVNGGVREAADQQLPWL